MAPMWRLFEVGTFFGRCIRAREKEETWKTSLRFVNELTRGNGRRWLYQREGGFPMEPRRKLVQMGYQLRFESGSYGGYQGILRGDNGVYWGASESREGGQAIEI